VKVLHILYSIEHSGLETMLLHSTEAFAAAGVEAHVLCTVGEEGRLAGRFREHGYAVHRVPMQPSFSSLVWLWGFLVRQRFDVVHVHTEQAFLWYGAAARLAGVPMVVHSVHSTFPFIGGLRLERIVQRRAASRLLGMQSIAPGPSVAENERRRFRNACRVVPNWVDSARFRSSSGAERSRVRSSLGIHDSAPVVVSVGACVALKQHDLVIAALPVVRGRVPKVRYLHVGAGPEEPTERELAERLGVADACRFVGVRDDVSALLPAGDVFVMPSQREGFGLAALEAMSCGLPVVASDIPGLLDVVTQDVTGLLVEQRSDDIAAALIRLLDDDALRARLGDEGRRRVLAHHTPEHGVEGWLRAYEAARWACRLRRAAGPA
jgi:glycosyltransferase involved in cell wall biosynthesis